MCVSALDTDSAGATQTDAARLHLNWFALKESKWSSTRLETARVRFSNGKNRSLSLSLSRVSTEQVAVAFIVVQRQQVSTLGTKAKPRAPT